MIMHTLQEILCLQCLPHAHIKEMLECIGQAKVIFTLNLTKGYWQILMAREDKVKATFGTPMGHFPI